MAPKPTGSGTRGGPRIKKEGQADLYRIGGVDLPYDPELDLDKPKPTPLFPVRYLSYATHQLTNSSLRPTKCPPPSLSPRTKGLKLPTSAPYEKTSTTDPSTPFSERMSESPSPEKDPISPPHLSIPSRACRSIVSGIRRRGG